MVKWDIAARLFNVELPTWVEEQVLHLGVRKVQPFYHLSMHRLLCCAVLCCPALCCTALRHAV